MALDHLDDLCQEPLVEVALFPVGNPETYIRKIIQEHSHGCPVGENQP
jgi:hypothetical protein